MEEEVITPPRGGGVRPLSLRVHHVGYEQYLNLSGGQFMGWRSASKGYWVAGGDVSGYGVAYTEGHGLLRTPAASQEVHAPRRAALTTTKVPRFDGSTSWEQYHLMFEAIVRSNSWDNDTAALQLFSHLEGDALNVAHLVPLARRLSRSGLVDALTAHYGSTGRLPETV